jgi:hypothetical protein
MKELADLCGSTQKRIGRALETLGLWKVGARSTPKARDGGYVGFRCYPNLENYPLTVWHRDKTLATLKTVGVIPLPSFAAPLPDEANDPDPDGEKADESNQDEDPYDYDEEPRTIVDDVEYGYEE